MPFVSTLAYVLGATAVLGVFVLPTWAPFLHAERVRALFGCWPTRSVAVNYLFAGTGVVCAQSVAYVLLGTALGGVSSSDGPGPFFGVLFAANLLVPAIGWLVAAVFLPRRRVWDPTGGGLDGRLVLAAGAIWYAVLASVVVVLAVFVLTFAFMPV